MHHRPRCQWYLTVAQFGMAKQQLDGPAGSSYACRTPSSASRVTDSGDQAQIACVRSATARRSRWQHRAGRHQSLNKAGTRPQGGRSAAAVPTASNWPGLDAEIEMSSASVETRRAAKRLSRRAHWRNPCRIRPNANASGASPRRHSGRRLCTATSTMPGDAGLRPAAGAGGRYRAWPAPASAEWAMVNSVIVFASSRSARPRASTGSSPRCAPQHGRQQQAQQKQHVVVADQDVVQAVGKESAHRRQSGLKNLSAGVPDRVIG